MCGLWGLVIYQLDNHHNFMHENQQVEFWTWLAKYIQVSAAHELLPSPIQTCHITNEKTNEQTNEWTLLWRGRLTYRVMRDQIAESDEWCLAFKVLQPVVYLWLSGQRADWKIWLKFSEPAFVDSSEIEATKIMSNGICVLTITCRFAFPFSITNVPPIATELSP